MSKPVPKTLVGPAAESASTPPGIISIRVSPHSYLAVLLISTFFSALFLYLDLDLMAAVLFAISWILVPVFALGDRIAFDGKSLRRTGFIPRAGAWITSSRRRLKIRDIEQVETQSIRAIRRGGNVRYRYRTTFRGKGLTVTISSGREEYRRLIKSLLPRLSENVLDVRSIELRQYLADSKQTLAKAETSHIPSADVLEGNLLKSDRRSPRGEFNEADNIKVEELQHLGNELRLAGYLLQALEAFRRALVLRPADARLLFDFARCLHSIAGARRDPKLGRKAIAALRLSERRATGDGDLLARLGEAYFQIGEWRRAGIVFQRVLDQLGENFRAARGMAEMALREGKIAHVIHHFSAANRFAETPALDRWTKAEAEYFSHLNADEEYMEMEIARVNLLDSLLSSKKTTIRIALLAFPAIVIGLLFEDDLVAQIGWAVATVSLVICIGLTVATKLFDRRIPYELMSEED